MVKYKIRQLDPNIFTIIIKNPIDRSLLFLRCQEYYESTNDKFFRKTFDMKEYDKIYNMEKYISKWTGFNIPYKFALECYDRLKTKPEYNTKYDAIFYRILNKIKSRKSKGKAYIIGIGDTSSYVHEKPHALYYMIKSYKNKADKLSDSLPKPIYDKLISNLVSMEYRSLVLKDELQAYLVSKDYNDKKFSKGMKKEDMIILHKIYINILSKWLL